MNDFLDVTILAVLQGIAEFLPISSSGHLVILQHILQVPEHLRLRLEVFLHAGTLVSILFFYYRHIRAVFSGMFSKDGVERRDSCEYVLKLFLSALPAIVVYFLFKDNIESLVSNARMVGALLMFTGAILIGTRYLPKGENKVSVFRAVAMGIGQAIALLPGVSRSGMTLAAARGGRVGPEKAAEFSFLMSAPLIVGGVCLEIFKGGFDSGGMPWGILIWGVLLSAVVGYLSLALLLKALKGRWFWLFGPYCIVAGLATLIFCE